jgi:ribose/xylose/arabinose/galactoside ABC-type transport system permease subunit
MLQGSFVKHAKLAIPIYIVLLLLLIITSIISPTFRSVDNIVNVISQFTPLVIVAIGQTIVLLLAGIDLSVGSVISFATVIMALFSSSSPINLFLSILFALVVGAAIGIINGLGIVKFNIPPLIMTLSTMSVLKGVALFLMPSPGGMVSMGFMEIMTQSWGTLSVMGILVLILYGFFFMMLSSTKTGRYIYAAGGDAANARKIGIPVTRITILGYTLSGVLAAVAGIVLAARIFSGDPIVGDSYSMDSIAAVVVGGTSLFGGIGGILGTFAGAILISLTNNVLNMLNVFAYYQYIVKGVILVLALFLFQAWGRKK